jgi:hypothetical protein
MAYWIASGPGFFMDKRSQLETADFTKLTFTLHEIKEAESNIKNIASAILELT